MPFTIDINSGSKTLSVEGGSPLLFTLAKQNIYLPTACGGRGLCGLCKLTVRSDVGPLTGPEARKLTPAEISAGLRLGCQLPVVSDLRIEIPRHLLEARRYKGVVARKQMLTYDIAGLTIALDTSDSINFVSGHYIQLETPGVAGDPAMRAYSLASPPALKKQIEIMVRKVPSGICSTWIHDHVKEGDKIWFSGPFGQFHLSDSDLPMIFIGGGSGMAPFWSMLRYMQKTGSRRKTVYFFGARTQQDLFLVNDLKELEKQTDWFTFIPALSDERPDTGWTGERGLITEVVKRYYPSASGFEAYLCGAPGMIDASIKVLTEAGMPEKNIFFDKF